MPDSTVGLSETSAALRERIEQITNAKVSLRPPAVTSRGNWKAIAHGGTSGLRACSGISAEDALRRLLASVTDEPEVPTR